MGEQVSYEAAYMLLGAVICLLCQMWVKSLKAILTRTVTIEEVRMHTKPLKVVLAWDDGSETAYRLGKDGRWHEQA